MPVWYNSSMENKKIASLKIWKHTQEEAKIIAALQHTSIYVAMDALIHAELQRLKALDAEEQRTEEAFKQAQKEEEA